MGKGDKMYLERPWSFLNNSLWFFIVSNIWRPFVGHKFKGSYDFGDALRISVVRKANGHLCFFGFVF